MGAARIAIKMGARIGPLTLPLPSAGLVHAGRLHSYRRGVWTSRSWPCANWLAVPVEFPVRADLLMAEEGRRFSWRGGFWCWATVVRVLWRSRA